MAESAYLTGIENHEADGQQIRVYSAEKSITDCIKFRRTVGVEPGRAFAPSLSRGIALSKTAKNLPISISYFTRASSAGTARLFT